MSAPRSKGILIVGWRWCMVGWRWCMELWIYCFCKVLTVVKLVGAFSPVNHKGLHQGWTQTSLYFQVSHSTSHHTTNSWVLLAYLYSADTQHRNLHPAGWPILFCRPTQEPCVSHSQHREKSGEVLEKNAGEWTGSVEISKKEIPGSKRSMYGYILTYSRL